MPVIQFTADAYAGIQKTLLPLGKLWDLTIGSFITKVFLASGDELERVSGRSADLVEEGDPRTTTELIAENESELALGASGTLQERRDKVVALRVARQGFRPEDVRVALAPFLDQDSGDVVVNEITAAQAATAGDATLIYSFYVFRDPALSGTADIPAAQIELDRIAHSHTKGNVIADLDFICAEGIVGRNHV